MIKSKITKLMIISANVSLYFGLFIIFISSETKLC